MNYKEYSDTIKEMFVLRCVESNNFFVDPDYKYEMIISDLTPEACDDEFYKPSWEDVKEILTLEAARLNALFDMSTNIYTAIDDIYNDKLKPIVDDGFDKFKDELLEFIQTKVKPAE